MIVVSDTKSIHWKVGRLRFAIFLPLGLLVSAFSIFLLLDRQMLALVPLGIFLFLTAWSVAGLAWPPEIDVSEKGVRYSKWGKVRTFNWTEIDGPIRGPVVGVRQMLKLIVKSTGEELLIAPYLFDSNYEQLAAIMEAAKTLRSQSSSS